MFTSDEHEFRIYAIDGARPFPIHGAIKTEEGWAPFCWTADGHVNKDLKPDDLDICRFLGGVIPQCVPDCLSAVN